LPATAEEERHVAPMAWAVVAGHVGSIGEEKGNIYTGPEHPDSPRFVLEDNVYVIMSLVIEIREYIDGEGRSPFERWFNGLNPQAAAKITTALERIANGNFSKVEPVGSGVSKYKIDWGPGYRIYFGKDGETIVILVGGGTKKRQSSDIESAQQHWAEYKRRKRREERQEQ